MSPRPSVLRRLVRGLRWMRNRGRIYLRWLIHEVPRNPRYELYARRQGRADRAQFLADRAGGGEAVRAGLAPFRPANLPRIIWIYWHQGAEAAPMIVRHCIESWRTYNPGWEVRVLDAESVAEICDMSDFPAGQVRHTFADVLRLRLLKTHGGVWADATVFCHRPLDDWLPLLSQGGFFAFRNPGPGREMSSWFLVSEKDHVLVDRWEAGFAAYLRRLTYQPDLYFMFTYVFQWQLRTHADAAEAWARAPGLPAQPSFLMMEALRGHIREDRVTAALQSGLPVSKLTWKEEIDEADFTTFCGRISTVGAA